jgi:hypothetical protein
MVHSKQVLIIRCENSNTGNVFEMENKVQGYSTLGQTFQHIPFFETPIAFLKYSLLITWMRYIRVSKAIFVENYKIIFKKTRYRLLFW